MRNIKPRSRSRARMDLRRTAESRHRRQGILAESTEIAGQARGRVEHADVFIVPLRRQYHGNDDHNDSIG